MSAKIVHIGHARQDENGRAEGPLVGDQTGKEVVIQDWYARNGSGVGWAWVLRCKNAKMREGLVAFIEAACQNDGIGYSQPNRGQLLRALRAGGSVETVRADCDCTSLIFTALIVLGLSVKMGYSANMYRLLMETGMFDAFTDTDHLLSDALAVRGDIYLRVGHAAVVLESGAGVSSSTVPDASTGLSGARITILGAGMTVNVRPLPDTAPAGATAAEVKKYKPIYTARSGEAFPVIGRAANGWYQIECPRGVGFVSDKLPRYVKYEED